MSEAAFQRPATSSSMPNPVCYFEGCKKESSYKNVDDDSYASPRIMRIPARAFNSLNRKSCAKHKLEGWTRISKRNKMCYFKDCLKSTSETFLIVNMPKSKKSSAKSSKKSAKKSHHSKKSSKKSSRPSAVRDSDLSQTLDLELSGSPRRNSAAEGEV